MKKILTLTVLMVLCSTIVASAAVKTTQKSIYKNNFIDVKVNQPVYTAPDTSAQQTQVEKNIKSTKDSINNTKKNFADIKRTWGIK